MKRGILPKILTEQTLKRCYVKEHKRASQIAKELGVKEYNVLVYLKKYAIRKVERWERYGVKKFTKRQKEYLYGSLLGDDCLVLRSDGKYPYLQVIHSSKSKSYVQWKYDFWWKLTRADIKKTSVKLNNRSFSTHRFWTVAHPEFLPFYNKLYRDEKKQITKEWLDNLTPLSLAIWYMDDGYFRKDKCNVHFITLAFGQKGNKLIKKYFWTRWKVKTNLQKASRGKDRYYLWMNVKNSIKFMKLIAPYILPCFSYKIDKHRKLRWKKLSMKELGYIRNNYNIQSPSFIASRLNRPISGIHSVAWRLSLTQPRGGRKIYQFELD